MSGIKKKVQQNYPRSMVSHLKGTQCLIGMAIFSTGKRHLLYGLNSHRQQEGPLKAVSNPSKHDQQGEMSLVIDSSY